MFEVNPRLTQYGLQIGAERTPIFVIDDFLRDCSGAIDEATRIGYSADKEKVGAYYPGVRAPVGEAYGMTVLRYAALVFYNYFKVPRHLTLFPNNGSYSLITKREDEMDLLQCIPHFDNNDTYSFAMLHYLNPGDFGGTGFYRHLPTGYENISSSRKVDYLNAAQRFIDQNGNPKRSYFTESTDHYELLHKVDYRPNRLVIYPATLLHSAYIEHPDIDVNTDPATGRLSANFFIEFRS